MLEALSNIEPVCSDDTALLQAALRLYLTAALTEVQWLVGSNKRVKLFKYLLARAQTCGSHDTFSYVTVTP